VPSAVSAAIAEMFGIHENKSATTRDALKIKENMFLSALIILF
jgi:hypothetical protein